MAHVRAMVIFENNSGLPEDRFVNTFHWVADWDTEGKEAIKDALVDFYNTNGPGSLSISDHMSTLADRTTDKSEVRLYNMADPEPREPTTFFWTLGPSSLAGNLPNEVCATLSFYADRNIPRQRGRVYLGPLNSDAIDQGSHDMVLDAGFRAVVGAAAQRLIAASGIIWAVYSPTGNSVLEVTNGWVDDACDTQRRRGAASTSRLTF